MADVKKTVVVEVETKGVKQATKQVNELEGGVAGLTDNLQVMGVSLGQVRGGLGAFTKGFKGLNTVLKASPLFLIVGVLTAIASVFTKTQGGIDQFNKAWEQLNATLDVLLGRLTDIGNAFVSLFSGDFTGFVDGLKESFAGLGEEIQGAVADAGAIVDQRIELEKQEIRLVRLRGQLRRAIEDEVSLSRDLTLSGEEREAAILRARDLRRQLNEEERIFAEAQLQLVRDELAATPEQIRTREQLLELAEAENALQETIRAGQAQDRELQNRFNEVQGQIRKEEAERLKRVQEAEDLRLDNLQLEAKLQGDLVKLREDDVKAIEGQAAAIENRAKRAEEAERQRAKSEQDLIIGLSLLNQDAGRAAAAVQQSLAIQDSFRALISGWASGFTIFDKIANVALIAGQVAALVRNVSSIQIGGTAISERFALGGMVVGRSHNSGGERFGVGGRVVELEGGESVINRRSTALFRPLLSAMNQLGGGKKFQSGGVVGDTSVRSIINGLSNQPVTEVPVLVVEDFNTTTTRIKTVQDRNTF